MTLPLSSPPDPTLPRAIREELRANLPPPQGELVQLLGVSDFLTCITVALGERAVGRSILPLEKLEPTTAALEALGLHVRRGWLDFMPRVTGVEGTDHDRAAGPRGMPGATHGMLYYARSDDLTEGAEFVEQQGQHGLIAELFGYPTCCSSVFTAPSAEHHDKTPDTYPDTGPYPREMNPSLPYLFGLHLLFHFPCSPRCEASLELLRGRLNFLHRYAPSCDEYARLGAGIAFYGTAVGIGLATRYRDLGGDTFELAHVITRSDALHRLVEAAAPTPVLRLHSVHDFELGGSRVVDARGLVARFE
ncbi:hypothetical protein LZ198_29115 [Myxococcus sp. K15C18031901]|uniref:hypothetical protein n=1 Tax=Myxococcus dinghuensis TaxID=2906761 RepID=UPI0020A818EA|nr:hypothetical protein [Myxococcus dinghuensis]MCP3102946.1 hypothetical protein [Myxococcus dinghuensis]